MHRVIVILFTSLLPVTGTAQVVFKTVVQQNIVEAGKSFYVSYMLETVDVNDGFNAPAFMGVKEVSGPVVRKATIAGPNGLGELQVKNYVFTLLAVKPGRYIIPGATAVVNGRMIRSDNVTIEVTEPKSDNESEYFLRPGEDPYEKMRRNLFMKVMVNKRDCYIGEPVVATFKLYSRLQSKSEIVKNPGFYGFSVQDIVNLDDKISATETIGGKAYVVHTIRTVQLYPLQAGDFTIDAMEVTNKVEFSKSSVSKKTEQEISEGVHSTEEDTPADDGSIVTYENHISTEKIAIHVKPYPEKNKPAVFNGATGRFSIKAVLEKNDLAKNEEGDLLIIVQGKGNFTQLDAPSVQWPQGMEGFEATVKDSLDKRSIPLKGTRTFRFPFVAGKPGKYIIPAIALSFFDIDSNKYRTIATGDVEIMVNNRQKEAPALVQEKQENKKTDILLPAGIAAAVVLITIAGFLYAKRKKVKPDVTAEEKKLYPSVDEVLESVYPAMKVDDSRFYIILQKSIWNYLAAVLDLTGSQLNKFHLEKALLGRDIPAGHAQTILDILQECEAAAFTKAEFTHDKQQLLLKAKRALEQIG